jgi:hypothetical protein
MALLEDAPVWGLPPLRPRLSRLLPRTRQSERVRATMLTRQRQRRDGDQQGDPAQVCSLFWKRSHLMHYATYTSERFMKLFQLNKILFELYTCI